MGNFEVKFIRITTSDKIADRFLTCQAHQPSEEKKERGSLFALIEILNPWFPTSQIGQTIINTLIREYYKGTSTSDLENFEAALQKVNETLASITQNGETDWIGNLNAILALLVRNNLHLSQSGQAQAFLFRGKEISHITSEQLEPGPHPLKTFSNINSGGLEKNDRLLITSPGLFKHLSAEALGQIFSISENISEVALSIVKALRKAKVKNVNLLLLELAKEGKVEKTPFQSTYYLDQPLETPIQILGRFSKQYLKPALIFLGKKILITLKIMSRFVTKALPQIKLFFQKCSRLIKSGLNIFGQKIGLISIKSKPAVKTYKVTHYEQKFKKSKITSFFSILLLRCKNLFKFLILKENRPILYVVLATFSILVLIVALNLTKTKHQVTLSEQAAKQTLKEAQALLAQAKISLSYQDTDQAKNLLTESLKKSLEIKNHPLVAKETSDLIWQVQGQLDQLTSTTRIKDLKEKATFPNSSLIFEFQNGIYTIDPKENIILRASLIDGRVGQVGQLDQKEGKIVTACNFPQNKSILIYTYFHKLYQFKFDNLKFEPINIKGGQSFENASNLQTFFSNIYLLDPESSQIYKHTPTENNQYLEGSVYSTAQMANLTGAVSFTIDGDVYVLNSDGSVTKLSRGRKVGFTLSGLPEPDSKIKKPAKIYTSAELNFIYILDNSLNRIIEFKKDGSYNRQFIFENLSLQDFTLNFKEKKLWIIASNKLFEIEL